MLNHCGYKSSFAKIIIYYYNRVRGEVGGTTDHKIHITPKYELNKFVDPCKTVLYIV